MTTMTALTHGPNTFEPKTVRRVALPQRFDVHEVPRFMASMALIAPRTVVMLDASEIRYMDRSAMDALIEARLRCIDRGGELTLAEPSVAARVILELSGRYDALNPMEAA